MNKIFENYKTLFTVIDLRIHRGGCIICMDYRYASHNLNYFLLADHHRHFSSVLTNKLYELENLGFDPGEGFIFGFSYGGRIALEGSRMFGVQKIAEIDSKRTK